jgi:microsomal dipeptidase-like Zn-dependent dipeptidase/gamma-glutamyl-gamma-aminobutyrate hydrolase PuuD
LKQFDLQAHLNEVYAYYPEGERRPIIGITGNFANNNCQLARGYYNSVAEAGGVPFIIPPITDRHILVNTLQHIDALILSGGGDINPLFAGEQPSPLLHAINAERDLPELLITRLAYNRQLPILGICRGMQTLAVALGGKVAQDLSEIRGDKPEVKIIKHSQDADRSEPTHSIAIEECSTLFNIYKEQLSLDVPFSQTEKEPSSLNVYVNSFHHQAVSDTGSRFRVVATAPDGIIEAMESTELKPILGVQWHPECMADGAPLFQWLVKEARSYRQAHEVHDRVLTLDTHCDTPMFFHKDINFAHRDPQILVDLHKMTEGRQDATIMVAYLPQPKLGETFSSKVELPCTTPTEYADTVFDRIESIVSENSQYIALARTPGDLYENKRHGLKSIMLGIENGLALNGQLSLVNHFAQRGVVYITLCHNGDNDLCDSARGCNTHGGVSRFGEQVIREMNRLGIMVDLSHASERSFYDALSISETPIVCSHSSCRALCNHPRNLTDDQMRQLAAKGGVMQITLYNGFLVEQKGKTPATATILDALHHLEHAIHVMGIDHVGLGTDFDGDGGICGLADSSELINFTRQLLRRNYNEYDIQKIWGGNFLRVMGLVQRMKSDVE